jgi:hypothetical protein
MCGVSETFLVFTFMTVPSTPEGSMSWQSVPIRLSCADGPFAWMRLMVALLARRGLGRAIIDSTAHRVPFMFDNA